MKQTNLKQSINQSINRSDALTNELRPPSGPLLIIVLDAKSGLKLNGCVFNEKKDSSKFLSLLHIQNHFE